MRIHNTTTCLRQPREGREPVTCFSVLPVRSCKASSLNSEGCRASDRLPQHGPSQAT